MGDVEGKTVFQRQQGMPWCRVSNAMELILARVPKPPPSFISDVTQSSWELGYRYAMFAGIAWLFCYVIFKRRWFHRKIIARFPQSTEVRREMLFSAVSVIMFSLV